MAIFLIFVDVLLAILKYGTCEPSKALRKICRNDIANQCIFNIKVVIVRGSNNQGCRPGASKPAKIKEDLASNERQNGGTGITSSLMALPTNNNVGGS